MGAMRVCVRSSTKIKNKKYGPKQSILLHDPNLIVNSTTNTRGPLNFYFRTNNSRVMQARPASGPFLAGHDPTQPVSF